MQKNIMRKAAGYLERARRHRRWLKVESVLWCVVVFCTVYALILPAITMEKSGCGLPEHTHTAACYTRVTAEPRKEPVCSPESLKLHQHTEECLDENGEPVCGYADFVIHEHDASCYDGEGQLWCPLPEIKAHTHSEGCFSTPQTPEVHTHTDECYTMEQGELICTETTGEAHTHGAECYQETETLVCDIPESEGHQHGEGCYDGNGELICTDRESDGHRHGSECYELTPELVCTLSGEPHQHREECYARNRVLICGQTAGPEEAAAETGEGSVGVAEEAEPELICEKEEIIPHEHTAACFDENGSLICGRMQVLEHVHNQDCFRTVEEAEDVVPLTCTIPEGEGTHTHDDSCYDENGVLVCQTEESTGHQHGPLCYGTWELTCGLEEHTHTEECNIPAELTEEEQAQVEEVIALIDVLPAQEEIEETLTAFEDAEDEDGYDAYLTELVTQVKAAYEAYSALTEAQQARVTNTAKLMALEPLWSAQTLEGSQPLTDDSARVSGITVTNISDGTSPWDSDDAAGNDSSAENKVVRTFDTVTYKFQVTMESYDNTISYSEARVRLEFVLPLTEDQATFDQGAMAWMDQTAGYQPNVTTEERNGVMCQVLTCYKRLLPSEGHPSVVPGSFGENVTVNVKSMKNGETFAPTFSAAMQHGTWEGNCSTHNQPEKITITADEIKVSAAPKYNIQLAGQALNTVTLDFNSGNDIAQNYGEGYGKDNLTGRATKLGLVLQLYNEDASKGFKGIELPDGSNITFDIGLSTTYYDGTTTTSLNDKGYMPLLWSCDGNSITEKGTGWNTDDRTVAFDSHGYAQNLAPWNDRYVGNNYSCYNGGTWRATQDKDGVIHVTVSGYQIDVDKMPLHNVDGSNSYGKERGIGCFSAGEVWIFQPYNKVGENGGNTGPYYDVINEYGIGSFTVFIHAMNMKATSVSGMVVQDAQGTSDAQIKQNDDKLYPAFATVKPGTIQNRVGYGKNDNVLGEGVGVKDPYDGLDFATPGTYLKLISGFSYNANNEESNILYWGTNLTKFYASAFELKSWWGSALLTGAELPGCREYQKDDEHITVLYATKPDGTDWVSDWELQSTYEDSLVFYSSLSEIPKGHQCVGLLYCFKGPGPQAGQEPYYFTFHDAQVRENMDLCGQTFMLVSTSRVWTKAMFESANMTLDNIPDWTDPNTSLSDFPDNPLRSANLVDQQDATWYRKETYAADGSGALGTHNSPWRHYGDTMLVIGYKTEITKNKAQMSEPDVEKNVYNLDDGQRVVDFKLQPSTFYDQGSDNHALTTTVTIVDTLPKYLTYRPGSSYFGGTYTQTSANGGTQGEITGGTLREPDSVVSNADRTQTLTWIIPGVTVGEKMPTIYYSADIGDKSDPTKDVSDGTTSLTNTVRISATHDIRQPSKDNRNYAEAGITVTRGAAASYGKYSKQKVVDIDGIIDYVIYYDNNGSTAESKPVLVDAMPVKGEGSSFTGRYEITSFRIILNVPKGEDGQPINNITLDDLKAELSYTEDEKYAGKDLKFLQEHQNDQADDVWVQVPLVHAPEEDGVDKNTAIVTQIEGRMPVMWVLNCISLPPACELRVEYTIRLVPEDSSKLEQVKFVNAFSTSTTTTTTETPAVRRTLEGLTWMDTDADGIQDTREERISGVKVTLLKLKDGGNPANEIDYEPYHYQGDPTKPIVQIETGQIVSVRATPDENGNVSLETYNEGCYKFTDLPAGIFAVKFTDGTGDTKISPLIASPSNRGTDDTQDSDGIATYSTDHSRLEKTVILGIEMPKAEAMSVTLYESKYHDSGFYEKGHELPQTGGPSTIPYTIGGVLLTGAGLLLLYKKRRKEDFASS